MALELAAKKPKGPFTGTRPQPKIKLQQLCPQFLIAIVIAFFFVFIPLASADTQNQACSAVYRPVCATQQVTEYAEQPVMEEYEYPVLVNKTVNVTVMEQVDVSSEMPPNSLQYSAPLFDQTNWRFDAPPRPGEYFIKVATNTYRGTEHIEAMLGGDAWDGTFFKITDETQIEIPPSFPVPPSNGKKLKFNQPPSYMPPLSYYNYMNNVLPVDFKQHTKTFVKAGNKLIPVFGIPGKKAIRLNNSVIDVLINGMDVAPIKDGKKLVGNNLIGLTPFEIRLAKRGEYPVGLVADITAKAAARGGPEQSISERMKERIGQEEKEFKAKYPNPNTKVPLSEVPDSILHPKIKKIMEDNKNNMAGFIPNIHNGGHATVPYYFTGSPPDKGKPAFVNNTGYSIVPGFLQAWELKLREVDPSGIGWTLYDEGLVNIVREIKLEAFEEEQFASAVKEELDKIKGLFAQATTEELDGLLVEVMDILNEVEEKLKEKLQTSLVHDARSNAENLFLEIAKTYLEKAGYGSSALSSAAVFEQRPFVREKIITATEMRNGTRPAMEIPVGTKDVVIYYNNSCEAQKAGVNSSSIVRCPNTFVKTPFQFKDGGYISSSTSSKIITSPFDSILSFYGENTPTYGQVCAVKQNTEYTKEIVEEEYQYPVEVNTTVNETVIEKVQEPYIVSKQVPKSAAEYAAERFHDKAVAEYVQRMETDEYKGYLPEVIPPNPELPLLLPEDFDSVTPNTQREVNNPNVYKKLGVDPLSSGESLGSGKRGWGEAVELYNEIYGKAINGKDAFEAVQEEGVKLRTIVGKLYAYGSGSFWMYDGYYPHGRIILKKLMPNAFAWWDPREENVLQFYLDFRRGDPEPAWDKSYDKIRGLFQAMENTNPSSDWDGLAIWAIDYGFKPMFGNSQEIRRRLSLMAPGGPWYQWYNPDEMSKSSKVKATPQEIQAWRDAYISNWQGVGEKLSAATSWVEERSIRETVAKNWQATDKTLNTTVWKTVNETHYREVEKPVVKEVEKTVTEMRNGTRIVEKDVPVIKEAIEYFSSLEEANKAGFNSSSIIKCPFKFAGEDYQSFLSFSGSIIGSSAGFSAGSNSTSSLLFSASRIFSDLANNTASNPAVPVVAGFAVVGAAAAGSYLTRRREGLNTQNSAPKTVLVEEEYEYPVEVKKTVKETVMEKIQEAYTFVKQIPRRVMENVNVQVPVEKVVGYYDFITVDQPVTETLQNVSSVVLYKDGKIITRLLGEPVPNTISVVHGGKILEQFRAEDTPYVINWNATTSPNVTYVRKNRVSIPKYEKRIEYVPNIKAVEKTYYDDVTETAFREVEKPVEVEKEITVTEMRKGKRMVEKTVVVDSDIEKDADKKNETEIVHSVLPVTPLPNPIWSRNGYLKNIQPVENSIVKTQNLGEKEPTQQKNLLVYNGDIATLVQGSSMERDAQTALLPIIVNPDIFTNPEKIEERLLEEAKLANVQENPSLAISIPKGIVKGIGSTVVDVLKLGAGAIKLYFYLLTDPNGEGAKYAKEIGTPAYELATLLAKIKYLEITDPIEAVKYKMQIGQAVWEEIKKMNAEEKTQALTELTLIVLTPAKIKAILSGSKFSKIPKTIMANRALVKGVINYEKITERIKSLEKLFKIEIKTDIPENIKSLDRLIEKLDSGTPVEKVFDTVRFRGTGDISELRKVEEYMKGNSLQDMKIVENGVKDYLSNPKPSGYRGINIKMEYKSPLKGTQNTELQLMTKRQIKWTDWQHSAYEGHVKGKTKKIFDKYAKEWSDYLHKLDTGIDAGKPPVAPSSLPSKFHFPAGELPKSFNSPIEASSPKQDANKVIVGRPVLLATGEPGGPVLDAGYGSGSKKSGPEEGLELAYAKEILKNIQPVENAPIKKTVPANQKKSGAVSTRKFQLVMADGGPVPDVGFGSGPSPDKAKAPDYTKETATSFESGSKSAQDSKEVAFFVPIFINPNYLDYTKHPKEEEEKQTCELEHSSITDDKLTIPSEEKFQKESEKIESEVVDNYFFNIYNTFVNGMQEMEENQRKIDEAYQKSELDLPASMLNTFMNGMHIFSTAAKTIGAILKPVKEPIGEAIGLLIKGGVYLADGSVKTMDAITKCLQAKLRETIGEEKIKELNIKLEAQLQEMKKGYEQAQKAAVEYYQSLDTQAQMTLKNFLGFIKDTGTTTLEVVDDVLILTVGKKIISKPFTELDDALKTASKGKSPVVPKEPLKLSAPKEPPKLSAPKEPSISFKPKTKIALKDGKKLAIEGMSQNTANKLVRKFGDEFLEAAEKYGTDAVTVVGKYGKNGLKAIQNIMKSSKFGQKEIQLLRDVANSSRIQGSAKVIKKIAANPKDLTGIKGYLFELEKAEDYASAGWQVKIGKAIKSKNLAGGSQEIDLMLRKGKEVRFVELKSGKISNEADIKKIAESFKRTQKAAEEYMKIHKSVKVKPGLELKDGMADDLADYLKSQLNKGGWDGTGIKIKGKPLETEMDTLERLAGKMESEGKLIGTKRNRFTFLTKKLEKRSEELISKLNHDKWLPNKEQKELESYLKVIRNSFQKRQDELVGKLNEVFDTRIKNGDVRIEISEGGGVKTTKSLLKKVMKEAKEGKFTPDDLGKFNHLDTEIPDIARARLVVSSEKHVDEIERIMMKNFKLNTELNPEANRIMKTIREEVKKNGSFDLKYIDELEVLGARQKGVTKAGYRKNHFQIDVKEVQVSTEWQSAWKTLDDKFYKPDKLPKNVQGYLDENKDAVNKYKRELADYMNELEPGKSPDISKMPKPPAGLPKELSPAKAFKEWLKKNPDANPEVAKTLKKLIKNVDNPNIKKPEVPGAKEPGQKTSGKQEGQQPKKQDIKKKENTQNPPAQKKPENPKQPLKNTNSLQKSSGNKLQNTQKQGPKELGVLGEATVTANDMYAFEKVFEKKLRDLTGLDKLPKDPDKLKKIFEGYVEDYPSYEKIRKELSSIGVGIKKQELNPMDDHYRSATYNMDHKIVYNEDTRVSQFFHEVRHSLQDAARKFENNLSPKDLATLKREFPKEYEKLMKPIPEGSGLELQNWERNNLLKYIDEIDAHQFNLKNKEFFKEPQWETVQRERLLQQNREKLKGLVDDLSKRAEKAAELQNQQTKIKNGQLNELRNQNKGTGKKPESQKQLPGKIGEKQQSEPSEKKKPGNPGQANESKNQQKGKSQKQDTKHNTQNPAPKKENPAPKKVNPTLKKDNPVLKKDSPKLVAQNPILKKENPVLKKDNPALNTQKSTLSRNPTPRKR